MQVLKEIHLTFTPPFDRYFLRTYCVPGTVLGLEERRTDEIPCPVELTSDGSRHGIITIESEHLPKAVNAAVLCLLFCDLHTRASALLPFGLWLYCLIDLRALLSRIRMAKYCFPSDFPCDYGFYGPSFLRGLIYHSFLLELRGFCCLGKDLLHSKSW